MDWENSKSMRSLPRVARLAMAEPGFRLKQPGAEALALNGSARQPALLAAWVLQALKFATPQSGWKTSFFGAGFSWW